MASSRVPTVLEDALGRNSIDRDVVLMALKTWQHHGHLDDVGGDSEDAEDVLWAEFEPDPRKGRLGIATLILVNLGVLGMILAGGAAVEERLTRVDVEGASWVTTEDLVFAFSVLVVGILGFVAYRGVVFARHALYVLTSRRMLVLHGLFADSLPGWQRVLCCFGGGRRPWLELSLPLSHVVYLHFRDRPLDGSSDQSALLQGQRSSGPLYGFVLGSHPRTQFLFPSEKIEGMLNRFPVAAGVFQSLNVIFPWVLHMDTLRPLLLAASSRCHQEMVDIFRSNTLGPLVKTTLNLLNVPLPPTATEESILTPSAAVFDRYHPLQLVSNNACWCIPVASSSRPLCRRVTDHQVPAFSTPTQIVRMVDIFVFFILELLLVLLIREIFLLAPELSPLSSATVAIAVFFVAFYVRARAARITVAYPLYVLRSAPYGIASLAPIVGTPQKRIQPVLESTRPPQDQLQRPDGEEERMAGITNAMRIILVLAALVWIGLLSWLFFEGI